MTEIDLKALSEEQKRELMQELEKEQKAKAEKEQEAIRMYKKLSNEAVSNAVALAKEVSRNIAEVKTKIFEEFKTVIKLREELYGVNAQQNTFTFTNEDSSERVVLGYRTNDGYDDTADAGIEMVKEYLSSLANDENTMQLVKIIKQLMSKDKQGNLKASRVLQLSKYANESSDERFKRGVRIIQDAYKPQRTKNFITVANRYGEEEKWQYIPLSMTDVEMIDNEEKKQ